MKIAIAAFLSLCVTDEAFVPVNRYVHRSPTVVKGYLDDLSKDLTPVDDVPDVEQESFEATKMAKEQVDRYGAGTFEGFVDFNEFDGGDGQMGVAGDGSKGLDKMGGGPSFATSKFRSAKNAWGSSTGYADELRDKGIETSRAQQLENWANQREVHSKNLQMKYMADEYDKVTQVGEEDWRSLAKFGVERNEDYDLNEKMGAVSAGNVDETIQLSSQLNRPAIHEMKVLNDYMGFADFRAVFTPETDASWTVEPTEGSLSSKTPVDFIVRFRPQSLGVSEGYLVIETEDFKKTYKLIGSTS